MARRRLWDALSESYRKRLLRGGITRDAYERGESLQKARGHAETPEHPKDAVKHPEKFRKYRKKKAAQSRTRTPRETVTELRGIVTTLKDQRFGDRFKYDLENQVEYVVKGRPADDIEKPSIALLREARGMSAERMEELASLANGDDSEYKEYRFLWYH